MKKIIMIKSVFDDTEAQELEESFNPITVALTDALFGEAHPFQKLYNLALCIGMDG